MRRLAARGEEQPHVREDLIVRERPAFDPGSDQLGLFAGGAESEVLDRLRGVDPERVTPLEALELLSKLVTRLGDPR